MHRTINLFLLLFAVASAFALYVLKYDTRRLGQEVEARVRKVEELKADIRGLKAEKAHLARPERIEPLARRLGLAPVESGQYLHEKSGDGAKEDRAPAPR